MITRYKWIYCKDFHDVLDGVKCCQSCHEDANEFGYDMMQVEYGEWVIEICCGIYNDVEKGCWTEEELIAVKEKVERERYND